MKEGKKDISSKDFVSLCKDANELIKEVSSKSRRFKQLKPRTKKSSAVHYLARKRGLNVTLNNLQIYGCYQETIINAEKIIRELDSDR